jgi:TolB-like protein/Flp pilus assembly protein TadD
LNLSAWLQELKRRRVFRALAGYGLVSFALLQVIEPVMHGLELPDWVLKVLVIGLGLGLPVTILLAWAYDLKATGIERTPSAGPGRGWRTVALVAIGLALAAPGVAWYLIYRGRDAGPAGGPSVAVLPFVNMSGDPENEYFSDGLSEEILNALAQVPGLRVPARTSSFAFKGKTLDVTKIAEALRVATVLEGSVRKAGGRVRITAQLVKAVDGYHLWSQTFDRELKDVFAVQDEISTAITGALKLQLAPAAAGGARKAGSTTNTSAYEAYLKGRQALNERTRASLEKSIVHFQRAVALDPGFAVAYADLAIATVLLSRGNYGGLPQPEAVARARTALEKAQALAPDRPEVLGAAGLIELNDLKPERSLQFLDRALAINPNDTEAHSWRRFGLEALGRFEAALQATGDAVRSDPLSRLALANYIEKLDQFGREAELGPALERLRALDEGWWLEALGSIEANRGDRVAAVRHLLPALQQGRETAGQGMAFILAELGLRQEALRMAKEGLQVYLALGDHPRALEVAQAAHRKTPDDAFTHAGMFLALYGAGRFAEAAEHAAQLDRAVHGMGTGPGFLLLMADAARSSSRGAEAASYRARADQLILRMQRDGVAQRFSAFERCGLAAYDGRDDEAVALLEGLVSATTVGRTDLQVPLFARLRGRPDFQALQKRLDAALANQRRQVVELLCGPQRLSATWQPAPETCAGR